MRQSLFPRTQKSQHLSTSSKFTGKEASWFEDNLEDNRLCFTYSLCRPFPNHFNIAPSEFWKGDREGEKAGYHGKSSDIFEDKNAKGWYLSRGSGGDIPSKQLSSGCTSVPRSLQSIKHSYPERPGFKEIYCC